MKPLLLGLLLGFVGGAGLMGMLGGPSAPAVMPAPAPHIDDPTDPEAAAKSGRVEPDPAPIRQLAGAPARADGWVDLEASELTLRIGDGYVFGEAGLRPRTERDRVDLYCQDIRHGASLRGPLGAAPALAPLTAIGLPESAVAAAALLVDAPVTLAARDLQLALHPTPEQPGIGFARSRAGPTFKLWLVELLGHPDALERRVRIGFAQVPGIEGGGQFRLPQTLGAPSAASLANIRNAIAIGGRVPGQNFHDYMTGAFTAIEGLEPETTVRGAQRIVVEQLPDQKLEVTGQGAVFVAGNMGPRARIVLARGGAAGVGLDLGGLLRTDGYAFLFVGRDVTGTLDVRSYATAVVLGDVRGTIRVRSYTDLYVRGRILGTLDLEGSCWSTFYFQSFLNRYDLEQLQGSSQVTLHLMHSDLAPGKHTGIGKWREVIVGDPLWQQLAR